ncbi:MAG: MaoC family dehydratase [Streptosporangiaceae bacterium]|jgi:acyl dehydratase
MDTYHGLAELEAAVGQEIGPTDWFLIDQARVDGFADDTEDHQWIHVDPERAAAGPFGGPVAHGLLTLSLIPYLTSQLRRVEGMRMGVNYGLDRVRFPNPVRVGRRVRARATMISLDKIGAAAVHLVTRVTIEVEGSDKPACVADMVGRCYFDAPVLETSSPAAGE